METLQQIALVPGHQTVLSAFISWEILCLVAENIVSNKKITLKCRWCYSLTFTLCHHNIFIMVKVKQIVSCQYHLF